MSMLDAVGLALIIPLLVTVWVAVMYVVVLIWKDTFGDE